MLTATAIASEIHNCDSGNIFQGKPYVSFCAGSDRLQDLGLWDVHGSPIDWELNQLVLQELRLLDVSAKVNHE